MNSIVPYWAMAVAACFLLRYVLHRNIQASIFFFFLGIMLIGLGVISISGHYMIKAIGSDDMPQTIINFLMLLIGVACAWVSTSPLVQIVRSWFKK